MQLRYMPLTKETIRDVVCLPGGLEVAGKELRGNIDGPTKWRERMRARGLGGVVAYLDGLPRGFLEFLPEEVAPAPIRASGAAVLMCYHWAGTQAEDPEHLAQEKALVRHGLRAAREAGYSGMAALGWDNPVHFPIALLLELEFREIAREHSVALLWYPFRRTATVPCLTPVSHTPATRSQHGLLAVETAYSTRCPYSIHHSTRLKEVIEAHPQHARIRYTEHIIDTRAQALTVRATPCDWWWVRFNGEEIDPLLSRDRLAAEISRRLPD